MNRSTKLFLWAVAFAIFGLFILPTPDQSMNWWALIPAALSFIFLVWSSVAAYDEQNKATSSQNETENEEQL